MVMVLLFHVSTQPEWDGAAATMGAAVILSVPGAGSGCHGPPWVPRSCLGAALYGSIL